AAFEFAAERAEKRLRRYKRRLTNHHKNRLDSDSREWLASAYVLAPLADEEEAEDDQAIDADGQPVIVAETVVDVPSLSVGEAVMRLDLADAPAMVFRNRQNGQFNFVYRRGDGNVGWVDPANGPADPSAAPLHQKTGS